MAVTDTATAPKDSFAAMLDESMGAGGGGIEGTVVKGRVISIENDAALIDVGLKSEGRVALKEFSNGGEPPDIHVGDTVEVFLERMEDKNGEASLSREKARREEAWTQLEKNFQANERVTGQIFGRVKGGFTVDLSGAVAFLPGSQVDIRPVRDIGPLMGSPQPFQILKMDRSRGNIVVSRRAVLEESRAEQRSELVASAQGGPDPRRRRQEHHRLRRLRRSRRRRRPACMSPTSPGGASTTRPRRSISARTSTSRSSASTPRRSASRSA